MTNNNKTLDIINLSISDKYKLKSYGTIFSILWKEGYINISMTRKLIQSNNEHYFNFLEDRGIIKRITLSEPQIKDIMDSREGMNEYNIKKMKAYAFTSKAIDFINSVPKIVQHLSFNLKTKLQNYIDKIKQRRILKKNERKSRELLEFKLLGMNFAKLLQKSGIKNGIYNFKRVGINNCLDFYKLKLREIARLTFLSKSSLEKIQNNITKELYNSNNFISGHKHI